MIFYFIIFFILAFLAFIEVFYSINRKTKILSLVLFQIVFFFISAFRWEMGTDFQAYADIFSISYFDNLFQGREILFQLANTLIRLLTNNYTIMLVCFALITQLLTRKVILQNSNQTILSSYKNIGSMGTSFGYNSKEKDFTFLILLIFFSIGFANIFFIRSTIAYLINLYSIKYIKQKKFIKFALLTAFATGFHITALIFLPAYFIYNFKLKPVDLLILTIILSLFVIAFGGRILQFMSDALPEGRMKTFFDSYLLTDYGIIHMEDDNNFSVAFYRLKGSINNLFMLGIFFFTAIRQKQNKEMQGLYRLFCFGFILFIGSLFISVNIARIAAPYILTQYFLFGYFISSIKKGHWKKLWFIIIILYLGLRMYTALIEYEAIYFPFSFFWG